MKRKTVILIIMLSVSFLLFADEDSHGRSLDDVLSQIRKELGVDKNSQINPDFVNEGLLEELGEDVMSLRHPDERAHEWMDNMMGGEGSESLRSAHIMMGYNYLSGTGPSGRLYGRGWMGSGFGRPMMGFPYHSGWGMHSIFFRPEGVVMFLILIALVLITVFVMTGKRKKESEITPFDILKNRLASGEIDIEEYEELKKKIL